MSTNLLRTFLLALALGAGAAACDDILVPGAEAPAGLAITLAPGAVSGLAPSLQEAFDEADSARVVLILADDFNGTNPFVGSGGRLADSVFPFGGGDTIRIQLELADSVVLDTTEIVMGLMLKADGSPIFVYLDSLTLHPNETTRAPVPALFPVPGGISLTADADSIDTAGDTTRVRAVGLLSTGDTIPDDQFFPDFQSLDPTHLQVVDQGTTGLVTSIDPGPGRILARAQSLGAVYTDTVTIAVRPPPPPADTAAFSQLAVGGNFACGVAADGGAYCWGSNSAAAFGNGGFTSSNTPVAAATGLSLTSLVAGTSHACGVATDDLLYCWGSNARGQLGVGTPGGTRTTPTPVAGGPWQKISAGDTHTCAIDTGGALYCWGANDRGQLGTGGLASDRGTPTLVGREQWSYVAAGTGRTCGVTVDGMGWCWGRGNDGGLGNGTLSDAFTPIEVVGGPWIRIRTGRDHTCGTGVDQKLYCWGRNSSGQLGLATGPSGTAVTTPQPAALQDPLSTLDPGNFHTCVVLQADGAYRCWGSNSQGQLGTVTPPLTGWMTVDASHATDFTCAIRGDQRTFCWGDGAGGKLGDGSTFDSPVPVPVAAP